MYKIDHPFFLKYICEPACDELLQPASGHSRGAAWPGAPPRRWLLGGSGRLCPHLARPRAQPGKPGQTPERSQGERSQGARCQSRRPGLGVPAGLQASAPRPPPPEPPWVGATALRFPSQKGSVQYNHGLLLSWSVSPFT